ncbi:phosphotransferase family protein [Shimia sp.]|uniref:phosphotransferase family protein n=1 Tax=Shimia sp. TaxID=1954381 RepID=UPI0035645E8E
MQQRNLAEPEVVALCRKTWGRAPEAIDYPGGRDRKTLVVQVEGRKYVLSQRSSAARAGLEAEALRALAPAGTVPGLVAQEGRLVIQTWVAGRRLTEALEAADQAGRAALLTAAGEGLLDLQQRGASAGLLGLAPGIAERPGWLLDFASAPMRLAEDRGLPQPGFDHWAVADRLRRRHAAFVKWDARPGNALLLPPEAVSWIDWEHCGVGSPEDDLVWLLADEWAPISPVAEGRLLARAAQQGPFGADELTYRFRAKAILHSAIRLSLIFRRKGDGPWWNPRSAMRLDRVGVSPAHVRRLCRRAAGWSAETEGFSQLVALFQAVARAV